MSANIGLDDVLAYRGTLTGPAGVGYGYGVGGDQYGTNSAIRADLRGNRDIGLLEAVNRNASDQFVSDRITNGNSALSEQIREQHSSDRFASLERLLLSMATDSQRDNASLAMAVAENKCCCEKSSAAILAEIKCNREVSEARQAGLNEAKLDALLIANSRPGNS